MVEGLTIGYGFGELEPNTSQTIDNETLFVKYAVGGFTIGYQESEADGTTAAAETMNLQVGVFLML